MWAPPTGRGPVLSLERSSGPSGEGFRFTDEAERGEASWPACTRAPRKHLGSCASLSPAGEGGQPVFRQGQGSQRPWRRGGGHRGLLCGAAGGQGRDPRYLPQPPFPPPQNSQLSCLGGMLQWRPREGKSLQPGVLLVPIKTNLLVDKNKGARIKASVCPRPCCFYSPAWSWIPGSKLAWALRLQRGNS